MLVPSNDKMHLVFRIEFDSVDAAYRAMQYPRKDQPSRTSEPTEPLCRDT